MSLVAKSIAKIKELHAIACQSAVAAIVAAADCGALLATVKSKADHGQWLPFLDSVGISSETARRYIAVAQDRAAKGAKWKLKKGDRLCDLYRALELLPPLKGGGYRSEKYQQKKLAAGVQLDFDFEFESTVEQLRGFASLDLERIELSESSIEKLERELEAALKKCRALKGARTIDLPDTE